MHTNSDPPASPSDPIPATPVLLHGLEAQARAILERHGCTVTRDGDAYVISYPHGTIKREMLPRLPVTESWRVFLPDGCELIQSRDTWRAVNQIYYRREVE